VIQGALADRYTFDREIGSGGMASVYSAHDLRYDRRVAIKVMRPELASALGVDRFLREVAIAARLSHPHILPLYDSGEARGLLYYCMPLMEGSLRNRLNQEIQLSVEEAIIMIKQIASALDHAHQQGLVHRDLKPENILLSNREAVLADFGIALALQSADPDRLTASGVSPGTPGYMSPEQVGGSKVLDRRTDIYSMGALLHEMLAGEPPHTGATAQIIAAKTLGERPSSLRIHRHTVSEAIDNAVMKALSKVPADRFATAGEFAAALQGRAASVREKAPLPWPKALTKARVVILTTVVAAAGLVWSIRSSANHSLDGDLVAVMPFRVSGPDKVADWLRQGMVSLASERFGIGSQISEYRASMRLVDPSTIAAAWRRAGGTDRDELSLPDAIGAARELRAGLLVVGQVVTTTGGVFTISGKIVDVANGQVVGSLQFNGPVHSLDEHVEQFLATLFQGLAYQHLRRVFLRLRRTSDGTIEIDGERVAGPLAKDYEPYVAVAEYLREGRRSLSGVLEEIALLPKDPSGETRTFDAAVRNLTKRTAIVEGFGPPTRIVADTT
jgi:tRNA A-37 threonylcarbamoyl transferase component Bud32